MTTTTGHPTGTPAKRWSRRTRTDDPDPQPGGRDPKAAALQSAGGSGAPMVAVPPKPRRRWGLVATMIVVVAVGALANVWLLGSMSDATSVVAAGRTIERGALIEREALVTVQVGTDPALRTVPAAGLEALVGQRAAVDIAAGTLITTESTTTENRPRDGFSLVGIAVTPAMLPGPPLRSGDHVRVVLTPGPQGEIDLAEASTSPASIGAMVLTVEAATGLSGQAAQSIVTVEVPDTDATRVAAMAATGRIAIVLDSRDR